MNKSISDSQLMDVDKQFMARYAIDHRHGKSYKSNLFHFLSRSQVVKEEVISLGSINISHHQRYVHPPGGQDGGKQTDRSRAKPRSNLLHTISCNE